MVLFRRSWDRKPTRADRPNALWQADHTKLNLLIVDARGRPPRPWLKVVVDGYPFTLTGSIVFLRA